MRAAGVTPSIRAAWPSVTWTDPAELERCLGGKTLDGGIVEARGQGEAFVAPERQNVCVLAIQITCILAVDLELLHHIGRKTTDFRPDGG